MGPALSSGSSRVCPSCSPRSIGIGRTSRSGAVLLSCVPPVCEAVLRRALVFQTHGVVQAFHLLHRAGASAFLNHVRERMSGNQGVDQFAVQPISELAQLTERDAVICFGLFGFVQRRPGDAPSLRPRAFRPTQGFSNEHQPFT